MRMFVNAKKKTNQYSNIEYFFGIWWIYLNKIKKKLLNIFIFVIFVIGLFITVFLSNGIQYFSWL